MPENKKDNWQLRNGIFIIPSSIEPKISFDKTILGFRPEDPKVKFYPEGGKMFEGFRPEKPKFPKNRIFKEGELSDACRNV